jgi:hypothetical protein
MYTRTLPELVEDINKVNANRRLTTLANIERLTSRLNAESDSVEKLRLQTLIELQNIELARLDAIDENDVNTLAQERFNRLQTRLDTMTQPSISLN